MVELLAMLKTCLCGSGVSSSISSAVGGKKGFVADFKIDPVVCFVIPGGAAALAEEVLNDSPLDEEKVEEVGNPSTCDLSFPFGSPVDGVPLPETFDRVDSDIQREKERLRV